VALSVLLDGALANRLCETDGEYITPSLWSFPACRQLQPLTSSFSVIFVVTDSSNTIDVKNVPEKNVKNVKNVTKIKIKNVCKR